MADNRHTIAVLPGTFDPVTLGHMDLIRRASRLFTRVIIGVGQNPEKSVMFTPQERVVMIRELLADLDNISVDSYSGLTMEFVRKVGAHVILRGIRDGSDLRDELQFANTNLIVGDIETVFLMTSEQNAMTSSTLIKQIVELGGANTERLANLVPAAVLDRLREKIGRKS